MKMKFMAVPILIGLSSCQTGPHANGPTTSSKEIDENNPAGESKIKNEIPLQGAKPPSDPVKPLPPTAKKRGPVKK